MRRSVCWLLAMLACAGWLRSSALSTQSGTTLNRDRWDPTTVEGGDPVGDLGGAYNPGDGESETEPEPEPEAEPEAEPESEAYPEPNVTEAPDLPPFAEPVPNWEEALPLYGLFWTVHIYVLGSLFALLALYSLVSLVRLRTRRLLSHGYFVALNLMMLLMGVDRAVYFFVDAYNYKGVFPLSVAYMLLGLGFPCLSSAFSILFLALLQSTQIRLVSPRIQRAKVLAGIIVFHFAVSVVVDITVGLFTSAQVLLLLCQGVFLVWGLFLSLSYLVIFRRLHKYSVRQFKEVSRMSMSRRTSSLYGISPFMKKPRNNWGSAIKVTLFASFFGVAIGLLQLYGILVVYGPLGEKVPEAWPWAAYQFAFRLCELVMCVLMSFVATQPFRYNSEGVETPMLMCWTSLIQSVTCKTSHELQENDDYRLVGANGDPAVLGNDDIRAAQRRVMFGSVDSEFDEEAANLRLPSSNTFHREAAMEEPGKSITLGTQAPETEAPESKNGAVVEEGKTKPDRSPGATSAVPNNTHALVFAPIVTQQWNGDGPPACATRNDPGPEDAEPANQNKNNHHSRPTTTLRHGGGEDPDKSDSDSSPPLTVTETEVPETMEASGEADEPIRVESAEPERTDTQPASGPSVEARENPDKGEADLSQSEAEGPYESTHF